MTKWWELMKKRAERHEVPIKPQSVAWELSDLLDNDAIVSGDSGTNTTWIARYFKIKGNQKI